MSCRSRPGHKTYINIEHLVLSNAAGLLTGSLLALIPSKVCDDLASGFFSFRFFVVAHYERVDKYSTGTRLQPEIELKRLRGASHSFSSAAFRPRDTYPSAPSALGPTSPRCGSSASRPSRRRMRKKKKKKKKKKKASALVAAGGGVL